MYDFVRQCVLKMQYRYVEENPNFGKDEDSDNDIEYDEDGNPIAPKKSKVFQNSKYFEFLISKINRTLNVTFSWLSGLIRCLQLTTQQLSIFHSKETFMRSMKI